MQGTKKRRLPHFLCGGCLTTWLRALLSYGPPSGRGWLRSPGIGTANLVLAPSQIAEWIGPARRAKSFELHREPVFIVGHWQAGHSLMHHMLLCDPQFAFVKLRHCALPACFSVLRGPLQALLANRLPKDRGVDSLPLGLDAPQGDDFLLAGLTPLSFYYAYAFPESAEKVFRRAILFEGLSERKVAKWCTTYRGVLRRVAFEQQRSRILSRNASNTARIPQILKMFPGARIIHMHRNPYETYAAQTQRWESLAGQWSLQEVRLDRLLEQSLSFYRRMLQKFLRDRSSIPNGQLIEVSCDQLNAEPLETMQQVYQTLGLGEFSDCSDDVERYIASRPGTLAGAGISLNGQAIAQVNEHWGFALNEWGYLRRSAI